MTEIQLLKAQVKAMEHATAKDVDRMERAAIQVESLNEECNRLKAQRDRAYLQLEDQCVIDQDNLTEIQLLKAQIVSREKEIDVMMRQRNLAEDKVLVLERREVGYLSELDDYARTVLHLRSQVKACEAEHGTRNDYDKV